MHFKTYLMGSALPDLFDELYGSNQFGKHNPMNDYNGAGVKFVLECCHALGFEDVSNTSISKYIQRTKGKFGNYFDEYYAFLEETFYKR